MGVPGTGLGAEGEAKPTSTPLHLGMGGHLEGLESLWFHTLFIP